MSRHIVELNFDNFEALVLSSEIPVVVDFWADWCGPCKALEKTLEALAADYHDRLRVASVDIDDNAHLANDYQIKAVPTLIFFHKGNVLRRVTGARSRDELNELFQQIVEVAQDGP